MELDQGAQVLRVGQAAPTRPGSEAASGLSRHAPQHDVFVLSPGLAVPGPMPDKQNVPARGRKRRRRKWDLERLLVHPVKIA